MDLHLARGRKTGGRRAGTPNKRTTVRIEAMTAAEAEMASRLAEATDYVPAPEPEFFRGDAHSLLRLVYRDPRFPMETRIDCAKAAIRFERPALTAAHVAHSTAPSRQVLAQMTTDQLRALLLEMDATEAAIDAQAIEAPAVLLEDDGE